MDQTVTIRFRWTTNEMLWANRYHFRHMFRPVVRLGLHFIFALMILAGYGLIHDGTSLPGGIVFIFVGLYWFIFWPLVRRWAYRRHFRNRPGSDTEIEMQAGPDKIFSRSYLGQSDLKWEAFIKMVRTPIGVMLYSNNQIYHWLPRHGFASDAEFERFVDLAKSKIQKHYDVA